MISKDQNNKNSGAPPTSWYDLFSRGARDWLRHSEKVRDSVREHLPHLIAGADVISRPENRTLSVPVRFLEHYRFRLADVDEQIGVGQGVPGRHRPGDILRHAQDQDDEMSGRPGNEQGGVEILLEFKLEDIVDWLWEELKLPNLQPRASGTLVDEEFVREGWDKRGVRSRLDRRRTLKEAIKRRSVQTDGPDFTNEDLRFRQLRRRSKPSTSAVVIFALDASSSMTEEARKLAKSFFFWVLQGLRRQYREIGTVFIAHTVKAWEFAEEDFFRVTAEGGTQSSSAFRLALEAMQQRFDPARHNVYLFYASDGDNFAEDQALTEELLRTLAGLLNFIGYVELAQSHSQALRTRLGDLFELLEISELAVASYPLVSFDDIWPAMRRFFQQQSSETTD